MHKTKSTLDYAHSDLWGPSRVKTHGGNRYFLTIIDDYNMKVWVYILNNKNDAYEQFKAWKILMENQTRKKLKCLRIDNGLEFYSGEFNKCYEKEQIARHRIIAHQPQQNRLAERMNRAILERVRCMLLSAGLPKSFSGEVV